MYAAATGTLEVDLIEEMRLRTWARENYVPMEDREQDWHPVVLEEMRLKDCDVVDGE